MADPAARCEHPKVIPEFDEKAAREMTVWQIRQKYPRFSGKCPDCGYEGIIYASYAHYIYGDY